MSLRFGSCEIEHYSIKNKKITFFCRLHVTLRLRGVTGCVQPREGHRSVPLPCCIPGGLRRSAYCSRFAHGNCTSLIDGGGQNTDCGGTHGFVGCCCCCCCCLWWWLLLLLVVVVVGFWFLVFGCCCCWLLLLLMAFVFSIRSVQQLFFFSRTPQCLS